MQGEVSYREPEDHSSFAGDLESGSGGTTYAAPAGNTAAKKAMLFMSILLFTVVCVTLVRLGNDRPPLRHDSDSPVALHELKYNKTSKQPEQGQLQIGSIISSASSDESAKYEYDNLGQDEEVADESEDVQSVTTWTMSTESIETTTFTDSSLLPTEGSSHSLLDNMEQQNHRPSANESDTIQIPYPTSSVPADYKKKQELFLKKNLTTISLVNSGTVDAMTNETLIKDSTTPYSSELLTYPEATSQSFMVNKFASTLYLPEKYFPSLSPMNGFMIDSSTNRKQKRSIVTSNFNSSVELSQNSNLSIDPINTNDPPTTVANFILPIDKPQENSQFTALPGTLPKIEPMSLAETTQVNSDENHIRISSIAELLKVYKSMRSRKNIKLSSEELEGTSQMSMFLDGTSRTTLLPKSSANNAEVIDIPTPSKNIKPPLQNNHNQLTSKSAEDIIDQNPQVLTNINLRLPMGSTGSSRSTADNSSMFAPSTITRIETATDKSTLSTKPLIQSLQTIANSYQTPNSEFIGIGHQVQPQYNSTEFTFLNQHTNNTSHVSILPLESTTISLTDRFTAALPDISTTIFQKSTNTAEDFQFSTILTNLIAASTSADTTIIASEISTQTGVKPTATDSSTPSLTNNSSTVLDKTVTSAFQLYEKGSSESSNASTHRGISKIWTIHANSFPTKTTEISTETTTEDAFGDAATIISQGSTSFIQTSQSTSTLNNSFVKLLTTDLSTMSERAGISGTRPMFETGLSESRGTLIYDENPATLPINTNLFSIETTEISIETTPIIQKEITQGEQTLILTDTEVTPTSEDNLTSKSSMLLSRPIYEDLFTDITTAVSQESTNVTHTTNRFEFSNTTNEGISMEYIEKVLTLFPEFGVASTDSIISITETSTQSDIFTADDIFTESLSTDSSSSLEKTDISTLRPILEKVLNESTDISIYDDVSTILPMNIQILAETTALSTETTPSIQEEIITKSEPSLILTDNSFTSPTEVTSTLGDNETNQSTTLLSRPIYEDLFTDVTTAVSQESTNVTYTTNRFEFSNSTNEGISMEYIEKFQTSTLFPESGAASTDGTISISETSTQSEEIFTLDNIFIESLSTDSSTLSEKIVTSTTEPILEKTSTESMDISLYDGISTILPIITDPFSAETTELSTETTPSMQEEITTESQQILILTDKPFTSLTEDISTSGDNEKNQSSTFLFRPITEDPITDKSTIISQEYTSITQTSDGSEFSTSTNEGISVEYTETVQTSTLFPESGAAFSDSTTSISEISTQIIDIFTSDNIFTESFSTYSSSSLEKTDISTLRPILEKVLNESTDRSIYDGISTIFPKITEPFSAETTELSTETTPSIQEEITTESEQILILTDKPFTNPTEVTSTSEDNETNQSPIPFSGTTTEDPFTDATTIISQESTSITQTSDRSEFSTSANEGISTEYTDKVQTSTLFPEFGVASTISITETSTQSNDIFTSDDIFTESLSTDSSTSSEKIITSTTEPILEKTSTERMDTSLNDGISTIFPIITEPFSTETIALSAETTLSIQEEITTGSEQILILPDNSFTTPTEIISTSGDNETNQSPTLPFRPITEDPLTDATTQESTSITQTPGRSEFSTSTNEEISTENIEKFQTSTLFPEPGTASSSTDSTISILETSTQSIDIFTSDDIFTESLSTDSSTSSEKIVTSTTEPILEKTSTESMDTSIYGGISTILPIITDPFSAETTELPTETTPSIQEEITTESEQILILTDKPFTNPTEVTSTSEDNETNQSPIPFSATTTEDPFTDATTIISQEFTSITQISDRSEFSTSTHEGISTEYSEKFQTSTLFPESGTTSLPIDDTTISISETSTQSRDIFTSDSIPIFTLYENSTTVTDTTQMTSETRDMPNSLSTLSILSADTTESIQKESTISMEITIPPESSSIPTTNELSTLWSIDLTSTEKVTNIIDDENGRISTFIEEVTTPISLIDFETTTEKSVSTNSGNTIITNQPIGTTEFTVDNFPNNSTISESSTVAGTTEFNSLSAIMTDVTKAGYGESTDIEDGSTTVALSTDSASSTITISPQYFETTTSEKSLASNEFTSSSWSSETSLMTTLIENYSTPSLLSAYVPQMSTEFRTNPTLSSQRTTPTLLYQADNNQRSTNNTTLMTPLLGINITRMLTKLMPLTPQFKVTTISKPIDSNIHRTTLASLLPSQTSSGSTLKTSTTLRGRNHGSPISKKLSKLPTTIPIEETSELKEQTKKRKTTTPMYPQLPSTKYFSRSTSTTRYYYGYLFPLPRRPSSGQPKAQQPKNYYEYYLRRGHFPLCAAVLAFLHHITECFK